LVFVDTVCVVDCCYCSRYLLTVPRCDVCRLLLYCSCIYCCCCCYFVIITVDLLIVGGIGLVNLVLVFQFVVVLIILYCVTLRCCVVVVGYCAYCQAVVFGDLDGGTPLDTVLSLAFVAVLFC